MIRCGVVVAGLLLSGCTSAVTGQGAPPAAKPTSASAAQVGSGAGLPRSLCDAVGDVPDLTTLLGAGWHESVQDGYCRITGTHGDSMIVLHHNPSVSLDVARADSPGTPRTFTFEHRPAFYRQDPDRVKVTVSQSADPERPGVLECTVALDRQDAVGEFALAGELLIRVMPRYSG